MALLNAYIKLEIFLWCVCVLIKIVICCDVGGIVITTCRCTSVAMVRDDPYQTRQSC